MNGGEIVKNILVVGSLNMDFVIEIKEMPKAGETVLGKAVTLNLGGKGANQAYTVGRLGGSVKMIGAVGDDVYGQMLIENLQQVGVEISAIEKIPGKSTGNAFITLNEKGENSIIVIPGTNHCLSKEMIDRHMDLIEWCDILIMQLEIPIEVVCYVKEKAIQKGKKIILDPAPARSDLPKELYKGIDVVKPNETELQTLIGKKIRTQEEAIKGAQELLSFGVKQVVLTMGKEGCLYVTQEESKHYLSEKVEAIDTTAAGDSFTAAMAVALCEGKSYSEAIQFGNKVSGIVVTRKGAQSSIPLREEV